MTTPPPDDATGGLRRRRSSASPDDASPDDAWLRSYAASLGTELPRGAPVSRAVTRSGALVARVGDVVVKVHHRRTDPAVLTARLAAVTRPEAHDVFVQPLASTATVEPETGRLVTVWPRVEVLDPEDDDLPWAVAGGLLARLHRSAVSRVLQGPVAHGGTDRLARAVQRVARLAVRDKERELLEALGARLLSELGDVGPRRHPPALVHGDWHLGQLGRVDGSWRLLDIDDIGVGDPAWDLGRPAGFWAAGLLRDEQWRSFLDGYRSSGGLGVPPDGDPWPRLDLPARCAVFVAAVRELRAQPAPSGHPASDLLRACERM